MKSIFAAILLFMATGAHGTTVLQDSFDTENSGAASSSYSAFSNFNVDANPFGSTVPPSLVSSSDCAGGAGSCVDIKHGSLLRSKVAYSFAAGETIRFAIQARTFNSPGYNPFEIGFEFAVPTSLLGYQYGDAFIALYGPATPFYATTTRVLTTAYSSPDSLFRTYSVFFTAGEAGFLKPIFYSFSYAGGTLIDNVQLDISSPISSVPEPGTWALMIAGFGAIGFTMRKRKTSTIHAF